MACSLYHTLQLSSDVVEHYTSQAPPQQQPRLPEHREPEKLTADQKSPVTNSSKQTPSLKCPLCEKTFDKIFQLNLHLSRHQVSKLIQLLCDSNKNMRTELSPVGVSWGGIATKKKFSSLSFISYSSTYYYLLLQNPPKEVKSWRQPCIQCVYR